MREDEGMPRTQYPITGTVTDVDGTTTLTSGTVVLINTNLSERVTESLESDGSFSVDAANTESEYSNGDVLQVVIYDSDQVKSTEFRHTIDTGLTGYDTGTLYMHWTKPILGEARLLAVVISNKSDSAEYTVDFYDRENDYKILSCDVGPNNTVSPNLGFKGLAFESGICVIREVDTANTVEVQMVTK